MALSMHPEWEGEERFDFNFALAAAQTGHYNQAIFPFERLLEAYPNNPRFRLELARCHFFLNNLNAAEHEFNQVAASNPPAEVQGHINRFLTRIAEQKQQVSRFWSAGVGLALGYDSNINAAADLDAIQATFYLNDSPALTGLLTLEDEQKSQGSAYYKLQGFGQYQQPLSKRTSLDFSASISQKDNTLDDSYDLTNLSLNGGFRMLRSNHNMRFGGIYRQYWLAGEGLQNQILGNVRWQWYFAPQWKVTSEIELGQQDNDQNDALDFTQWQVKASLNRKSEGLSQNGQLGYGSDSAIESSNNFQGRNYLSIGYQMQQEIAASQQIYALINYRNNSYADAFADDHIFFAGETREDQLTQITAGWLYSFMPNTSAKVQLSHSQNQSNLELYDYQRTLIEAGLTISFK
jgi:Tetratricopeptide repeat